MSITGSCICGSVHYRVASAPRSVVNCHCTICRRHSGNAFSSYLVVPEQALTVESDADAVARHEIKEAAWKHFCRHCGTPLYNRNPLYDGLLMVYLGTAEQPEAYTPTANIYCDNRLAWVPHVGELRNFPQAITKQNK